MNKIEKKEYNLLQNIIYVYKYVWKFKPYLIGLILLSIISTLGIRFVWLFLSKYVIEYIIGGMLINELLRIIVILSLVNIVCSIIQNAVNYWKEPAALFVRPMFMLKRNRKHMEMMYQNLEYSEVLDAIQKSKNATSWIENGVEGLIRFVVVATADFFTCLFSIVFLCYLSPMMIPIIIIFGILSYLIIDNNAKKEKELLVDSVAYHSRKNEYFKKISKDFTYGKDIRLFNIKKRIVTTQDNLNRHIHNNVKKAKNNIMVCNEFTYFFDLIREGFMYFFIIYQMLFKNLSIGNFTLYTGCVRNFAIAFSALINTYTRMRKCSREVNDYRTLEEFCDMERDRGKEVPDLEQYEFRFENVSFKYPGAEKYSLKNINIVLNASKRLAIVGLNGAGKTTFIKLLLGLYKPTEGKIYLNDVDIELYNRKSYYELFSPAFQDMECYAFSVSENVSMKKESQTDKELVERVLRKAGLGNKLNEWEKGVDTQILKILYDDGVLLSGGEKQKLALARALYKDAPVVVLDEPTAALDPLAESKMYQNFDSMVKDKTAVYISHRLASTRFCDIIAMFVDGSIIEYGTHSELMNKGGEYKKMFDVQSQYYKENEEENDEEK